MPLCHHLIEGIKVGSIPITNCEKLLFPNLSKDISLQYSNLNQLIEKIHEALKMDEDKIIKMRSKVQEYYNVNLSPEVFKENFKKIIFHDGKKIICCDDHRSVTNINWVYLKLYLIINLANCFYNYLLIFLCLSLKHQ